MEEEHRRRESIGDMLDRLRIQIRDGEPPESALYTAVNLISVLIESDTWGAERLADLDRVYGDLRQQSFFRSDAAVKAERLQQETAAYRDKLEKQLKSRINALEKLENALKAALNEAYAIPDAETDE